jgi:hypothetical protein
VIDWGAIPGGPGPEADRLADALAGAYASLTNKLLAGARLPDLRAAKWAALTGLTIEMVRVAKAGDPALEPFQVGAMLHALADTLTRDPLS